MTLIDQNGERERPICRDCLDHNKAFYHRMENCPRDRARKRRARLREKRWWADLIAYRDAISAHQSERREARA